jgi:hypothetical protein
MVLAFKNTSATVYKDKTAKDDKAHIITEPEKIHTYFSQVAHKEKDIHEDNYGVLNIGFTYSYKDGNVEFKYNKFSINPKENILTRFCDWNVISMIKFFLYNAENKNDIYKAYSNFFGLSLKNKLYNRHNISDDKKSFSLGQRMNLHMAYLIVDTCIMLGININKTVDMYGTDKVQIFHLSIKPDDFLLEIEEFILLLNKHYDSIIKFNDKHKERCKKLLNEINEIKKNKDQKKQLDEKRKELKAIKEEFEKIFISTGDLSKLQGMFMNIFPIKPDFQILNNKRNAEEAEKVKNTKKIHFEDVFGWKKYGTYLSSEEYIKYVFIDNDYDNYEDTLNITNKFFNQFIDVKK